MKEVKLPLAKLIDSQFLAENDTLVNRTSRWNPLCHTNWNQLLCKQ